MIKLLEVWLDDGKVIDYPLVEEKQNAFIYSVNGKNHRVFKKPSHEGNCHKVRSNDRRGQVIILNELRNKIKKLKSIQNELRKEFKKY